MTSENKTWDSVKAELLCSEKIITVVFLRFRVHYSADK